jgi:hypothetical protein
MCSPILRCNLQAGYYISPEDPDAGPSATGWRIQRWESVQKPVVIHALLDSAGSPPAMMTTWTAVVNNTINKGVLSNSQPMNQQQKKKRERPMNHRAIGKASFSAHGGEVAIAIFGGEVHVFSGVALTPIDVFSVQVMSSHLAAPAFSPTSCCLASVWHDHKSDTCVLRIVRIPPVTASAPLTWDRHLADRYIIFFFMCSKPAYVYFLCKFHCASSLLVFCIVLSQRYSPAL